MVFSRTLTVSVVFSRIVTVAMVSVFVGGNKDHRQDTTRRVQPAEGVPGGEDPQNAQTPTHYQTIPGKFVARHHPVSYRC